MITVIGSLKGGSGKSTLTFNLAVWLALAEVKLRVLDIDPQATLRDVAEIRHEEGYAPAIEVEGREALDDPKLGKSKEVLIDIGPSDIESMKQAIRIADRILVPVPPSQADIWSTQRFIQFVGGLREGGKEPEIVGFINRADTHLAVRETEEAAAALVSLPGIKFIKPRLSLRTAFRRSFSEGLAVFEMEPNGKAAREFLAFCAKAYPKLVG
jgi:chromosome partitioning protein